MLHLTAGQKKTAFSALGEYIKTHSESIDKAIHQAMNYNQWFSKSNIQNALYAIAKNLEPSSLNQWLAAYKFPPQPIVPKKVGLILAGNIPLVGFHDILSVLMSGHHALIKTSSQDTILIRHLFDKLIEIEPGFHNLITFCEKMEGQEAIIATGSNNSARYFEFYFSKYPHIIRKNRNSVAVLNGKESLEELQALGKDIFMYFGLGCRNVSKLFVPEHYHFDKFFQAIEIYHDIRDHSKYLNNYEYNRSILLLNQTPHLDNGFLMLIGNKAYSSSIASLHYETYSDLEELKKTMKEDADQIQCIVSSPGVINSSIPFGQSQEPLLSDYADGIDTMNFLLAL